jgi:DNA polymerase-3 subunit beta
MRLKTNKAKLSTAVSQLQSIVPPKSTIPILSNILFDLEGDKLQLKVTDLDVSMTSYIDVDILDSGSITVPARVFSEIVKELPDYELEITATENRMEIKCGAGIYKLSGFSAEDFPKLPDIHPGRQIKVNAQSFYKMIKKVLFAVSKDETRPALNGVLWHTSEEGLNLVATDGHRLAKVTRKDVKITGYKEDIIIPPKENDKLLLVEKDLLQAAVRRVSILSNALTRQVKFAIKHDSLELSATNYDFGGEAKESLKVSYSDEEMDIGYNALYILDVVKQIDDEEVRFELSNPTTAVVIKPQKTSENESSLFLIMPLRLVEQ